MQLHKNRAVQIMLFSILAFWNVIIAFNGYPVVLMLALILLILIPFAAVLKNREDWDNVFSVFLLMLFPLHSYFLIHVLHSCLLYRTSTYSLLYLWIPYIFQVVVLTNYLIIYLEDYYRHYHFYGINSLAIFNHALILASITVISIKTFHYFSDRSMLNELIAKEISLESVKTSYTEAPFFRYFTEHFSTMKIVDNNARNEFLLPVREEIMMEYQGALFESTGIQKNAFSNEILFKSPTDTFQIEIIRYID